jgi:hypothetical protein
VDRISIVTMHLVKGVEFRAVAVNGLRRQRDPVAGANRECCRRGRSRRGLQH